MTSLDQSWLPERETWSADLKAVATLDDERAVWDTLVALAGCRVDFLRTNRLDRVLQQHFGEAPPAALSTKPVRLAVLGSSTLSHLLSAIRVAGLRRGLWITTYETDYGMYQQELEDPESSLHAFGPTAVLVALDAWHLLGAADAAADAAQGDALLEEGLGRVTRVWELAQRAFGCSVVQQTLMPVFPTLLGNNEHRLPGSRASLVTRLNARLRDAADQAGVDVLALDARAAVDGVGAWHDPVYWHRAKQEVGPAAAPMYGDLLGRLLAAQQGRSSKCLVLDLDNTLWGGVIGDDGLEGIVLGQGSALGEAFVDFQSYARELAKRGVILAVCSKNDEANALEAFERHPDMILRRADIACFVANWTDKATNLRTIAAQLNIGLDALVFVDDNPFERNLVREELPMVAVPEVPTDPSLFAACLAGAGYFESVAVTPEDRERTVQYQANLERDSLRADATDMGSYLAGLDMKLIWRSFDEIGLQRIVQLINKTNQFNLTTRRYNEDEVRSVIADENTFGLQLRLTDRFGDNGVIGIVIGQSDGRGAVEVDTWLMSCRVLGRTVEAATLNLVVDRARALGADRVVGTYLPTAKNGMVRDHYPKLGFSILDDDDDGSRRAELDVTSFVPVDTAIETIPGDQA